MQGKRTRYYQYFVEGEDERKHETTAKPKQYF